MALIKGRRAVWIDAGRDRRILAAPRGKPGNQCSGEPANPGLDEEMARLRALGIELSIGLAIVFRLVALVGLLLAVGFLVRRLLAGGAVIQADVGPPVVERPADRAIRVPSSPPFMTRGLSAPRATWRRPVVVSRTATPTAPASFGSSDAVAIGAPRTMRSRPASWVDE